MEVSEALQGYAEQKINNQILKFVTKPIEVHVTISVDKHLYKAHCNVLGGDGFRVQVEHVCEDMYGSIDRMVDKLATQLKRKKDKLKNHKHSKKVRNLRFVDPKTIDYQNEAIDAVDIIEYERRRKAG